MSTMTTNWFEACRVEDVPANSGACILVEGKQIAIFNFERRNEWFATNNQCPHRQQMILSRGMIGNQGEEPKVACPFHKKAFSLKTGACLNDENYRIETFPVQIREGKVYVAV